MAYLIQRHLVVGFIGVVAIYFFWLTRPDWDSEMRFWRAIGDGSLMLLYASLVIGPTASFIPRFRLLLPYRRELGIWFGIFAVIHTIIILDGWVSWDFYQFMGYQYIPAIDQTVRMESGFGMANLLGLLAVFIALPLMATSTDWASRSLGVAAWKFIHYGAYIIFYAVALHTAYFLYIHYTMSFHRTVPDPNWFQIPFAILTGVLVVLQFGAFFRTVALHRRAA